MHPERKGLQEAYKTWDWPLCDRRDGKNRWKFQDSGDDWLRPLVCDGACKLGKPCYKEAGLKDARRSFNIER